MNKEGQHDNSEKEITYDITNKSFKYQANMDGCLYENTRRSKNSYVRNAMIIENQP